MQIKKGKSVLGLELLIKFKLLRNVTVKLLIPLIWTKLFRIDKVLTTQIHLQLEAMIFPFCI